MKLTLKGLVKLIAPYLVAIGGAIGVYADGKARFELMEYRVQVVEKDKDDLRNDLKSIKDVLYRIDTRAVKSVPVWIFTGEEFLRAFRAVRKRPVQVYE
jgi:hypothetical protein